MTKITPSLLALIFILSACQQVPAGGPAPDLPPAAPTVISSPTTLPATSTQSPEATATATAGTESPSIELNIDPAIKDKFSGIEKYVTTEGGRFYATIGGEKYTLQGGWNIHAEMNNPYAPATVDVVDSKGAPATLIWNKEGLSVNAPLSTDIENPTDFSDADKITTLQKFLLQNPDPFTERSKGLIIRSEFTENGKVSFLRTDYFGNQTQLSNVWLRYRDPNGKIHWVNPVNLNDVDMRKVIMCAYGDASTNQTNGVNPKFDKEMRAIFLNFLIKVKIVWPILKAESSFFNNFQQTSSPIAEGNATDLNDLLNFSGNKPTDIPLIYSIVGDSFDGVNGTSLLNSERATVGDGFSLPIDPIIQEMIIPCQIK